jgi:hypothetical protein
VWVRGAIVKGPLYCGKSEIFGPALIEAYKLEENLAKYPKIRPEDLGCIDLTRRGN